MLESKSLQTYTKSWRGEYNPKMNKIMKEFQEECQPILDKYMMKFARENIEYCSLNGALYEEFASMVLSARLQAMIDLPPDETSVLG